MKVKNTEILFNLFSFGFPQTASSGAAWRSGLKKNKTEKFL
jgi:hypothetical protein